MTDKPLIIKSDIDSISLHYGWATREKQRVENFVEHEVIAFAEWCDNMGYTQVGNGDWKSINDKEKSKTSQQLYKLYTNSKTEK